MRQVIAHKETINGHGCRSNWWLAGGHAFLGVDGVGLWDQNDWWFSGGKTAAYRQIGNAFPPPVAAAAARQIFAALSVKRIFHRTSRNPQTHTGRLF